MRMLLLAAAGLALAGCTTVSTIDTSIQKNLPDICAKASTAHSAFTLALLFGSVDAKTVEREAKAWAVLEPLCSDPSAATTGSVIMAALNALATIEAARAAE